MRATHCARCGVRDHALGGRTKSGGFMLALPVAGENGRIFWPKIGTNGWCGIADGEVERLPIIRIALTHDGACQHCLADDRPDLFNLSARKAA